MHLHANICLAQTVVACETFYSTQNYWHALILVPGLIMFMALC